MEMTCFIELFASTGSSQNWYNVTNSYMKSLNAWSYSIAALAQRVILWYCQNPRKSIQVFWDARGSHK